MSSSKSSASLSRLQVRQNQAPCLGRPKYRLTLKKEHGQPQILLMHRLGRNGGRKHVLMVGDPWLAKGYWILYWNHERTLYRVWTATRELREVRAWVRWFESNAFHKEHLLEKKSQKEGRSYHFHTHPKAPAEGVWLGWRRAVLRPQPGDTLPEWIQRYSRLEPLIQIRESQVPLFKFARPWVLARNWDLK